MDVYDDNGELAATNTFTQQCFECEPPQTVNFINGERVPSKCDHELPGVVIDI